MSHVCWIKTENPPFAIPLNKKWKRLTRLVFITVRAENDISKPITKLMAIKIVRVSDYKTVLIHTILFWTSLHERPYFVHYFR